ncbi:MAG: hypothetical protein CVV22_06945 [Ignavibacteriae bacterium HGW-Ignavibacteriae-1]|jgi:hypothetical protein|nr:MAG: hypothetical protein CVV22_06945 [Ignavibacteriae bacterium HGW-Ignavibacteriae-1]
MNTELNKYFAAAKEMNQFKEPLDDKELNSILAVNKFAHNSPLNVELLGSIAMLTFLVVFSFLSMNQYFEISNILEIIEISSKSSIHTSEIEHTEHDLIDNSEIAVLTESSTKSKHIEGKTQIISQEELTNYPIYIKNPFRTEALQRPQNVFTIGNKSTSIDFLEPGSIQTDAEGSPIPGLITLNLTKNELAKLNIQLNENTVSYPIEYFHQLHPIPMRNNKSYSNLPANYELVERNYPVNGDTLLIKTRHEIDLKDKLDESILVKATIHATAYRTATTSDTIDGKIYYNLKNVILHSSVHEYIGMDYAVAYEDWKTRALQGFVNNIAQFGNWAKDSYSKVVPIIAAFKYNNTDHKYVFISHDSPISQKYIENMDYSKLLPIEIKFNKNDLIEKLVLWYYPTDEFIESLPERYKKALKNEIEIISSIESGTLSLEEACNFIEEESFYDYCRFANGAIEIQNLYPNPVYNGSITMKFKTTEVRNIEINIYDIQGAFIGRLSNINNLNAGEHHIKLNLINLTTGTYLIGLKSDKNEFVSQRIIIN